MIQLPERVIQGQDYPVTLADFQRMFPDDQACRDYLFNLCWPDGFRCPRPGCQGTQTWRTNRGPTSAAESRQVVRLLSALRGAHERRTPAEALARLDAEHSALLATVAGPLTP